MSKCFLRGMTGEDFPPLREQLASVKALIASRENEEANDVVDSVDESQLGAVGQMPERVLDRVNAVLSRVRRRPAQHLSFLSPRMKMAAMVMMVMVMVMVMVTVTVMMVGRPKHISWTLMRWNFFRAVDPTC